MTELSNLIRKYEGRYSMSRIIGCYMEIRDKCLDGREINSDNLDEIMPRIKANLELRLMI